MRELLAFGTATQRDALENLWLGYTETWGAPDLRRRSRRRTRRSRRTRSLDLQERAKASSQRTMCFDAESHAVVVTPNYQSHESLPSSICQATGVPLDPDDGWSLDIDRVAAAVRPNTKLITINFPHNPTGAILDRDRYDALIELCRHHGLHLLHDEIFNGLGPTGTEHLPFVADVYEKGLSLNVMSKAFGLPGLRLGWIASHDTEVLSQMERMKHYLSICNAAPRNGFRSLHSRTAKRSLRATTRSSMRTFRSGMPSSIASMGCSSGSVLMVPAWGSPAISGRRALTSSVGASSRKLGCCCCLQRSTGPRSDRRSPTAFGSVTAGAGSTRGWRPWPITSSATCVPARDRWRRDY